MLSSTQSLEQFLSDTHQCQKFEWEAFVNRWKYRDVCKMLSKTRPQLDQILSGTLSPRDHSIAYSYILGYKSNTKLDDPQTISNYLQQIKIFITHADCKQVVLCPRPFTDALRIFVDYMKREDMVGLIPHLRKSIELLQGGNASSKHSFVNLNILTIAHAELMQCTVESYRFDLAFPIIEQDIIEVQGNGCIKAIDNLRYHFYAGLIYIGLKKYSLAMEFLSMVCTAPSESISLIQIEAYKKYILVSLIRRQTLIPLPRYCPRVLSRYFPKFCSEYMDIATAFNSGVQNVSKLVERNLEIYRQDYNFGLVKQVLHSCEKNAVRKLTSVYTRLSSEKVASLCKFESADVAKRVVISMIRNRELSATLDAEGVITFKESVTETDRNMLLQIQNRIEHTLQLWNGLDRAQLKIKQSEQWIAKTLALPTVNESDMQQMQLLNTLSGGVFFH